MKSHPLSETTPRSTGHESLRLSFAYVAILGMMGIQLPYWPVWLADRGMEADQIGLLLGVFTWARLAAPWAGSLADRQGRPDRLAVALAGATLACTAAFTFTHGFLPLFLLSAVWGLAMAPIMPLVDGISVAAAAKGRLDYGRVRVWGSAAFVIVSMLGGHALQGRSPSLVLTTLIAAAAALLAATCWLPRVATPVVTVGAPAVSQLAMLRRPRMAAFLGAIACMQGSHAVLYGFGTQHWLAIGINESAIGGLWAWGVIVEVALFAIGNRLVVLASPAGLLVVAGLGGVIRWPLLATVESVPLLFAIQTLHATTFAAMHLGAMNWIRDSIDGPSVQRATSLYVAVGSGIALGVGMPLAGVLFEHHAGGAYHAMAVSSGIGLLFALRLWRARAG